MKDSALIKVTAIICLTIICVVALQHGINSALTGTLGAIIGGVAGYEYGKHKPG